MRHKGDNDVKGGLMVGNKYDLVNAEEDSEEERNDIDEKGPILTNTQTNIGCAIINTLFGMVLVVMMNLPGAVEFSYEIIAAITIGSLMALTSSISLIWYLTCYMEAEPFKDLVENHIAEKEENDPAFAKMMLRGWIVQERRFVEDRFTYIEEHADEIFNVDAGSRRSSISSFKQAIAEQDGEEKADEKANDSQNLMMGGSAIDDGEDIVDDAFETRAGESSPTAGATYAEVDSLSGSRSDPTKPSGGVVEMTKIFTSTTPIEKVPDPNSADTPSKSILKTQDSVKRDNRVSFMGKDDLFKSEEQAKEYQKMADIAVIKEDEEYDNNAQEEEVEPKKEIEPKVEKPKPAKRSEDPAHVDSTENIESESEMVEKLTKQENPKPSISRINTFPMASFPISQILPWEDSVDQNQAPPDFYNILFSAAHLKLTFKKHKEPLKAKVPNGFDLDGMDENELSDIISSPLVRKRILREASKLATKIKTQTADRRDPTRSGDPTQERSGGESDEEQVGLFLRAPDFDDSDDDSQTSAPTASSKRLPSSFQRELSDSEGKRQAFAHLHDSRSTIELEDASSRKSYLEMPFDLEELHTEETKEINNLFDKMERRTKSNGDELLQPELLKMVEQAMHSRDPSRDSDSVEILQNINDEHPDVEEHIENAIEEVFSSITTALPRESEIKKIFGSLADPNLLGEIEPDIRDVPGLEMDRQSSVGGTSLESGDIDIRDPSLMDPKLVKQLIIGGAASEFVDFDEEGESDVSPKYCGSVSKLFEGGEVKRKISDGSSKKDPIDKGDVKREINGDAKKENNDEKANIGENVKTEEKREISPRGKNGKRKRKGKATVVVPVIPEIQEGLVRKRTLSFIKRSQEKKDEEENRKRKLLAQKKKEKAEKRRKAAEQKKKEERERKKSETEERRRQALERRKRMSIQAKQKAIARKNSRGRKNTS